MGARYVDGDGCNVVQDWTKINLDKTKSMVCMPVFIWREWGEKAYKLQATGEGATFRERKRMQVSCTECGVTVL